MEKDIARVLLSEEQIQNRVRELADCAVGLVGFGDIAKHHRVLYNPKKGRNNGCGSNGRRFLQIPLYHIRMYGD